jgi:hypothetical protein
MYLTPVVLALKVLARPDYPTNIETMQRTWESLRYPIARLQEALRWIQTEMLGGEENIDRRTWRARVGRFFGPSPSRGTT